ncbi:S1 RNA-binding domain-containing protein, partial [bacterium]|nr:S1 RNA-binding domain-containing protein [bacterium]
VKQRQTLRAGFQSRRDLLKAEGVGESAFTQAAGFCRVPESKNVFDNTIVHPESYGLASRILKIANLSLDDYGTQVVAVRDAIKGLEFSSVAESLGEPEELVRQVIHCLCASTNDPREDLPLPVLREEILKFDALKPGHELPGVVRNIVEFGLFVDIGVNVDGLLHKSRVKNSQRAIEEQFSVGQQVMVTVTEVDLKRKRISLEESS